jgi:MoaA/NifB/PqqE/SkfB family radical SAM enzyme
MPDIDNSKRRDLTLPEALGLEPRAGAHPSTTPKETARDGAENPLRKLYVEVTNRCNISCSTCVRNAWNEPAGLMKMEVFERLVEPSGDTPHLQTIQFGGYGEPLLHPDISGMVWLAHERHLRTEVLTNGLLLGDELSEALGRSGLDAVIVSLDGATPATYSRVRRGSNIQLVTENLYKFTKTYYRVRRALPEIGIVFVAMKSNFHEFGALRSLALSLGANSITVTNLLPHTKKMMGETLYGRDVPTAFEPEAGRWNPYITLPKMDLNEHTTGPIVDLLSNHPNVSWVRSRLSGWENYCPFVREGRAAVSWDGGVSPCLALMHSYKCFVLRREKTIRRCVMGNVRERRFADIWNDVNYTSFRNRVARFDFPPCPDCGSCELVASNEEDCLGNPFPVCGDCLWARGILQCP